MSNTPSSWPSWWTPAQPVTLCQCLGSPKWAPFSLVSPTNLQGTHSISPGWFFTKRQNNISPQYQTLRNTAGDQRFVETLLGDRPPVSSCCWNSIWDHWSFIGTNCTSQGEISIVPVKPWRLQWADHLNPSHFHYYIFFNKNSNAICEI